jgi:molybdopterin synthase sulfur carrier subunit
VIVKVLFFGSLVDKTESSSVNFENANDLNGLMKNLKSKFPFLEESSFVIAVNQVIVRENVKLNNNDEIALLPPFAGG